MVNAKEIKNRIKSVHDTRKITNAMYMIASIKMRRAKSELDRTRPYFDALQNEIKRIFRTVENIENKYFYPADGSEAPDGTYGILVITADKGLAGSYNKNVIKEAQRLISVHPDCKLFIVGEYGRRFFSRQQTAIEGSFQYTAENPTMKKAREISSILLDLFNKGEIDKIFVVYSDLENSLTTEVKTTRLLPFHRKQSVSFTVKNEEEVSSPFEFFPSLEDVIDSAVKNWLSGFIFSALVDSFCSEQSARMTAMNSANKNAEKILESLTLQYNQVRQAAITQEITEVTSGVKAQKRKRKKEVS
ncbi:MAG: ATP synthase F1 subunit gamma [Tissierellia bacterium]|nr:ATP synthase F1 subunit gamma [Tissierellia bacterium]